MIKPLPGYMIDPNNPNGVIKIPNLNDPVLSDTGGMLLDSKVENQGKPGYDVFGNPVGKAVISTQGVKKDILDPIQDSIKTPMGDPNKKVETPIPVPSAEDQLLKQEMEKQKSDTQKKFEMDQSNLSAVLDPLQTRLDASKNAQIDTIKSQYQILRNKTEEANIRRNKLQETIGFRFGGRFTPEHTADLVQEKVNEGVQAIQELNAQESAAISTIQNAFDEKSYTLAVKKFDELNAIRKERDTKLAEIEKAQVEGLKKLNESQRAATLASSIGSLMKQGVTSAVDLLDMLNKHEDGTPTGGNVTADELDKILKIFNDSPDVKAIGEIRTNANNLGASPEILDAISKSKTFGEAVKAAGKYGRGGTGIIGEYNLAVAGGYTGSPDEYMTADANRKRQIINMNAGGLTTQENQTYLTITNKYQADPIVNAAIKADQVRSLADQIIADPKSATNQLASLYIFVKNLDPDSAVREGELSLANQTQSYLQKWGNSLERVSHSRIISPDAAKELAQATKDLVATWEDTAKKKTNMYKSQARNSSPNVGDSFDKYISDFETVPTVAQESQGNEQEAETKITTNLNSIKTSNPNLYKTVSDMYISKNPETGRPYSALDILQAFPELNK